MLTYLILRTIVGRYYEPALEKLEKELPRQRETGQRSGGRKELANGLEDGEKK